MDGCGVGAGCSVCSCSLWRFLALLRCHFDMPANSSSGILGPVGPGSGAAFGPGPVLALSLATGLSTGGATAFTSPGLPAEGAGEISAVFFTGSSKGFPNQDGGVKGLFWPCVFTEGLSNPGFITGGVEGLFEPCVFTEGLSNPGFTTGGVKGLFGPCVFNCGFRGVKGLSAPSVFTEGFIGG